MLHASFGFAVRLEGVCHLPCGLACRLLAVDIFATDLLFMVMHLPASSQLATVSACLQRRPSRKSLRVPAGAGSAGQGGGSLCKE